MSEHKFYKEEKNNSVTCLLCNHFCQVKEGQVGLCGTRKNKQGILQSLVYGYPSAINVDPIEKKPLFHFYPGSMTYSLGTFGCNFQCANCQNWDISQVKKFEKEIEDLDYYSPERIINDAVGDNCESISYTYNEPTIFTEYALEIMKSAHVNGLKNVWVSNGYMTEACLNAIIPYLDAVNIDLKSFDEKFYQKNCKAKLAPILKNLKTLKQEQVHIELTTLIIPGLSSEIEMLSELAEFIASELDPETPWHVSRFSPEISWKLGDLEETGDDLIYEAYEIGKNAGLKYVYVGNIPGDQKENTYCPKCDELAIRRLGYHIDRLDNNGRCNYCDKNLDIID